MLPESAVRFTVANLGAIVIIWLLLSFLISYSIVMMSKKETFAERKPPSFFLALGFPVASVFEDTWHEIAAVIYLQALVLLGDSWPGTPLSPAQVRRVFGKHALTGKGIPGFESIIDNDDRLKRVAARLTDAHAALSFSRLWANAPRCDCTHVCSIGCAEHRGEEHACCACMCHEPGVGS